MQLHPENLYQCPICKGKLENYSLLGIGTNKSCYCPKCNIVRMHLMSMPYLCSKCNSAAFYRPLSEYDNTSNVICWYCGNDKFTSWKYDDYIKNKIYETEGFKLSVKSAISSSLCEHKHTINKRHNKTIFKYTCTHCFGTIYISIPEWMQKEKNIGDEVK